MGARTNGSFVVSLAVVACVWCELDWIWVIGQGGKLVDSDSQHLQSPKCRIFFKLLRKDDNREEMSLFIGSG
jgi:hypothetical protein